MPICYITQENYSLIMLESGDGFLWQEECEYVLDVGFSSFGHHGYGYYEKNWFSNSPFKGRFHRRVFEQNLPISRSTIEFINKTVDVNFTYIYSANDIAASRTIKEVAFLGWSSSGQLRVRVEMSDMTSQIFLFMNPATIIETGDYVSYEQKNNQVHCAIVFRKYALPIIHISFSPATLMFETYTRTLLQSRCINEIRVPEAKFNYSTIRLKAGPFVSLNVYDRKTGGILKTITSAGTSSATSTQDPNLKTLANIVSNVSEMSDPEQAFESTQTVDIIINATISNIDKLLQTNEEKPIKSYIKYEGIRSINGVRPDADGNISIYGQGATLVDLSPDNNSRRPGIVINVLSYPCVSCDDLSNIIDRIAAEIKAYNQAAKAVRNAQQIYKETVFYVRKMLASSQFVVNENPDLEPGFPKLTVWSDG